MIPAVKVVNGEELYSATEALERLAGQGLEVNRGWLYLKVRGRDRSNVTYTRGDRKTNYKYKVNPLLREGRDYRMIPIGRREFVYITRAGIDLLVSEYEANEKGGTLLENGYTQIEKTES